MVALHPWETRRLASLWLVVRTFKCWQDLRWVFGNVDRDKKKSKALVKLLCAWQFVASRVGRDFDGARSCGEAREGLRRWTFRNRKANSYSKTHSGSGLWNLLYRRSRNVGLGCLVHDCAVSRARAGLLPPNLLTSHNMTRRQMGDYHAIRLLADLFHCKTMANAPARDPALMASQRHLRV